MTKLKRILVIILQILSLMALLLTISHSGFGALFGSQMGEIVKVVIEFGVILMSVMGAIVGIYLPSRRHRLFRDTQIHVMKYISYLGLYQVLMIFITHAAGGLGSDFLSQMPSIITNIIMLTFAMLSFMMPFNYMKSLFTIIKSVEYRDPRDLIRQLFS